ncbi:hypothetical protein HAHE_17260 [Haloferula helveola]|uniref:GYF domain-containing protein n=1 Tax=Haloferula helveola TaxID=490095 RepID=A0ABM7RJQ2_9BACT|nr:hypothetical protein HAHE_17260 [Haloferula helveola]
MAEESRWFYLSEDQQLGPISQRDLQLLAGGGSITPETLLWCDGLAEWIPASNVEGLFPPPRSAGPRLLFGAEAVAAPAPVATAAVAPAAWTPTVAQAAPPGTDYPSPPPGKVRFGWFVGLASFLMLMPPATVSLLSFVSKEAGDLLFLLAMMGALPILGLFIGGLMLLAFGVFKGLKMVALYKAWNSLAAGGIRRPPGMMVGFLFIPLFGFYWMFFAYFGLAREWKRIRATYPNLSAGPELSEGMALAHCVTTGLFWGSTLLFILTDLDNVGDIFGIFLCLPLFLTSIVELIYLHGLCRMVNFMGRLHDLKPRPSGLFRLS